ncbi:hypothetical protein KCP77_03715 [Salmonella enterica subsp. enterica]|nr:hypothetical protein KCP77_03715 [Salmonella enterica subsp. enterica]
MILMERRRDSIHALLATLLLSGERRCCWQAMNMAAASTAAAITPYCQDNT